MYPMGLVEEKAREGYCVTNLEGLPPVQRGLIIGDVEAAGTPIIMVHGVIDNHSIFTVLRRSLSRRGFGRVISLNYSPLTDDIRRVSRRLAMLVESVCRETGYERVHIVGHSMGGVIARHYVQCLGGDSAYTRWSRSDLPTPVRRMRESCRIPLRASFDPTPTSCRN